MRSLMIVAIATLFILPLTAQAGPGHDIERTLTVYTRDIALVEEVHPVSLEKGDHHLRLCGMPETVIPGTARLEVLDRNGVSTRSLAYSDKRMDMSSYWNARLGTEVTLVLNDSTEVTGYLGRVTDSDFYLFDMEAGHFKVIERGDVQQEVIDFLPDGVAMTPYFRWAYSSRSDGEATVRLVYMVEGLHWSGEHRLMLDGGKALTEAGFLVHNGTGMPLDYDELVLVGGHVHLSGDRRAVDRMNPKPGAIRDGAATRAADLHRWRVETPGILPLDHESLVLTKGYGKQAFDRYYLYDATIFDDRTSSKLEMTLESALPQGDVRIFEMVEGEPLFIGEDRLDDTPAGSQMELTLGQAFDITAERIRVSESMRSDGGTVQEFRVVLGNSRSENVTIRVLERVFGMWEVRSARANGQLIDHEREDARTARFDVAVPAGETVTLSYEIHYER